MTIPIKIISKKEYLKLNKKPDQEEVWDDIALLWSEYRQAKLPIIEEFLKNKKGNVIDLGCGSGRNMIINKDLEYYEVDISSCQLKEAKNYAKSNNIKASFFKLSADKLSKDFKDEMFDYGLFIASLHCIDSKEKRKKALKEFYRVLKKNSEAIITVWNSEDERFNCVKNKGEVYMSWRENENLHMRYYYLYEKKEFLDLLNKIGFKVVEFYSSREHDRFSRKNWIVRVRK